MIDVSCIVLTHASYRDKGGSVEHTVRATLAQRGVSFEIIVVQNDCDEQEQRHLRQLLETHESLRTVVCATSIAGARNRGAALARGRILVFLDDDTVFLEAGALHEVARLGRYHTHGYGARRLWTPPPPWFAQEACHVAQQLARGELDGLVPYLGSPDPAYRGKSSERYLMRTFIGCFGFVQKSAYVTVGGFPEEFLGYGYEDDALCAQLYATFGDFASLAALRVAHVTHPCAALGRLDANRGLYEAALARLGARAFHVGDLLYPEEAPLRPVLDMREC
jgi:glycosyltransferase involved in cell wall biosynthesis